MNTHKASGSIDSGRRHFLNGAAVTFAASQFGLLSYVKAESSKPNPSPLAASEPGNHTAFASIKQIQAGGSHY